MGSIIHFSYNLILASWIGGITVYTFVVTPSIFRSFGRDMAGEIVGKIFPVYFMMLLILSIAALLVILLPWPGGLKPSYRFSVGLIVVTILLNLFVSYWLYPTIRDAKAEIRSFENLSDDASQRKNFRRLHAVSATLNLIVLANGVVLLLLSTTGRR